MFDRTGTDPDLTMLELSSDMVKVQPSAENTSSRTADGRLPADSRVSGYWSDDNITFSVGMLNRLSNTGQHFPPLYAPPVYEPDRVVCWLLSVAVRCFLYLNSKG